ncbi:SprT-like domain-containing protein [Agromyces seonyuensis]|uniref:M48 family peptidase n=1 Tax=Agromyces seonyuensis TaxID=2662446 RepID=A0A6I4P5I3_9MICO|nr:SprT-like domain-containing protein [Agromyces seonyuensis]MWC00306.1 M48 family peptidase [Agromyces seonyuensis]
MAELERVRRWAEALIRLHLDPDVWSFGFDHAKRRAGQCNHTAHRITVSRYLAERWEDDDIHQVLLHEIAHAMAGADAAHGPVWLAQARALGYTGGRTHSGPTADEFARWVGRCPAGHEHVRHRKPTRPMSCGRCRRAFSPQHLIVWNHREVTPATRTRAIRPESASA